MVRGPAPRPTHAHINFYIDARAQACTFIHACVNIHTHASVHKYTHSSQHTLKHVHTHTLSHASPHRSVMLHFLRSKPDAGAALKNLFTELDRDNSVCICALVQASVPTNAPRNVQPISTHIFLGACGREGAYRRVEPTRHPACRSPARRIAQGLRRK